LVGGFLNLTPEFCLVVEDDVGLVGYAFAALDAKQFHKKLELGWLPEMCRKYPQPEKNSGETLSNKEVNFFNYFDYNDYNGHQGFICQHSNTRSHTHYENNPPT
jgi:protein O-GlcNAcase/histone acetyltransferase